MAKRRSVPFVSLSDVEEAASRAVGERIWSYVMGGAGTEWTDRANRAAFGRWVLKPRALAGIREVDLRTEVLGEDVRAPFYVAPTAYQGLVHPDGEVGMARAAARAGVLAVFSTLSTDSLEAIARARPRGPRWFQLYLQPEWEATERLVRRADRAGFTAIVLTADVPVLGVRDRQLRSGFAIDSSLPVGSGPGVVPPSRGPRAAGPVYSVGRPHPESWEVVNRLRSVTDLPIVVKGVLDATDARRSVAHGAKAVVVSNHGGRQLDRSPPSLAVLPEVVRAVRGRAEVYLDGGVRRGTDILVALALGARAVGLGRPLLWALAAGGEAGVEQYLSLLATDTASAMILAGRGSVSKVDRTVVSPWPG
ncbi:MAG TPA: alpha-hydroxy acid oxidase [Thermoplasmata archaeon]|nr:alpha-hydroxy acid oxidase [Thermoplasmata archaeon]